MNRRDLLEAARLGSLKGEGHAHIDRSGELWEVYGRFTCTGADNQDAVDLVGRKTIYVGPVRDRVRTTERRLSVTVTYLEFVGDVNEEFQCHIRFA